MLFDGSYRCIDLEKTGRHLEKLIKQRGYSAKDIQNMLNLSCPQPVYRWLRGQMLPSVDHLYVLAKVLQVHMEELLIAEHDMSEWLKKRKTSMWWRMSEYRRKYLQWEAA